MIKGRVALLTFALFLLVAPAFIAVGAVTVSPNAASIAITLSPAKLPADGLSYPSVTISLVNQVGKPTIAWTNTTVFLSVSESNVGSIPRSVQIDAGQTFVVANFTTTTTPGQTVITASSPGLASSSAQIVTETPSGFPDHIQVFATPSTLLARPSGQPSDQGTLILELTDDQGLPAKTPGDLAVQLFSSDTSVVSLAQSTLTIRANQTLATGLFFTSFTPGSPTITASASGYTSGSVGITVEGPAPLKLVASAQPITLGTKLEGLLMIALTDQSGDPARAPAPINVTLRSSNTTVATIPNSISIPAGSIYAWVNYTSTSSPGTATLTATSPGLQSSSSVITTFSPSVPVSLKVLTSPNPVLSDNQQYADAVVVELMGANSRPAVANGISYTVSLSSSTSLIGSVPSTIVIPSGSSYAVASFKSTYASGTTTITASATNLLPDNAVMATFGPVPYRISLGIYGASAQSKAGTDLPADGGSYPALAVSLVDSSGVPAIAPENIVIQLSSSKTDVVGVDTTVTIQQGSIYTLMPLQTSTLAGTANITASSVGLLSGGLPITTEIPAPTKLATFLSPAVALEPRTGNAPYLYIQLQDADGNPALAREATRVVVTSSNAALFNETIFMTIPRGADFARLQVTPAGVGSTTLTASASGLASSSATLQVISFPFSANITLSQPSFIYNNQTEFATVQLSLLGTPLQHVNVTWNFDGAVASPLNGTTNTAGTASTMLTPVKPGPANVTASATSPMFGKFHVSTAFTILQVPAKPSRTTLQVLYSYLYYIAAIAAAGVVASVYLLRRRGKQSKAELEAGFEAVS